MASLQRLPVRMLRRQPMLTKTARSQPHRWASASTSPKGTPPYPEKPIDPVAGSESFGTSFYLFLTLFPISYILYSYTSGSSSTSPQYQNPITALLAKYADYRDSWEKRNALHTRAVEQAGHDRNLFLNTPSPNFIGLRFPEKISMGSPIAVPAGHTGNIDALVEKYRNKAFSEEAEKMERLRKGQIEGQRAYKGP